MCETAKRRQLVAQESTAPTGRPRWLSNGTKRFEHNGIVVYPAAVVIDYKHARLTVVVRAIRADPAVPAGIDLIHARIVALVVSESIEITRQGLSVALYLRYPGNVHVALDAELKNTAERIEVRHEQLRRQGRVRPMADGHPLPGQVVAYVLSSIGSTVRTSGDLPTEEMVHDREKRAVVTGKDWLTEN